MSRTGVNINGFLAGLRQAAAAQIAAATKATSQYAAHVIGDAQEDAPVDTGALAASGTWDDAEIKGDFIIAEIGFGVDYAAAVHERWMPGGARSKNGNPLARGKFLEMALRENAAKFGPFVADKVKAVSGGAGGGGIGGSSFTVEGS